MGILRHKNLLLGLALVALAFLAFSPAVSAPFAWDDQAWLHANELIPSGNGWLRIWTEPGMSHNPDNIAIQYYPITLTSYWIEYRVYGFLFGAQNAMSPAPYHVMNILLQGIAAVLLWRGLKFLRFKAAWVAAAIWAVHPMQVESVAWISERKNVLAAVFFFAAILAYFKFEPAFSGAAKRRWGMFSLALILFLLAIFSKATALAMPAIVLAMLWWKKNLSMKNALMTVPFFAVGLAFAFVVMHVEHTYAGASGANYAFTLAQRVSIAGMDIWFYFGKIFFPYPLLAVYPRFDLSGTFNIVFAILAAAVFVALFLLRKRIGRGAFAAAACFFILLFQVLGFINFYTMIMSFVADHYAHLAVAAVIIPLTELGAAELGKRFSKRAAQVTAGVVIAALVAVSFLYSTHWQSNLSLWSFAAKHNPNGFVVRKSLAFEYLLNGDRAAAEREFREAVKLYPDKQAESHLAELIMDRDPQEAYEHAKKSIEGGSTQAFYNFRMARVLTRLKRHIDANEFYIEAVRGQPKNVVLMFELAQNWGAIYDEDKTQRDYLMRTIAAYFKTIELSPDHFEARFNLANRLSETGRYPEAIEQYRYVYERSPTADVCLNYAFALHQIGRDDLAVPMREQGLKMQPAATRP